MEYFKPRSQIAIGESHFKTDQFGVQHWVFGMVDILDERNAIFKVVSDRSELILLPFIQEYARTRRNRKTTVITDGWRCI